jgi:hypothetical protein
MYKRLDRAHRAMSLVLGALTLVSLGLLLAWNVNPKCYPIRAHGFLAAFPLAMIAIAYLLYQSARRPARSLSVAGASWSFSPKALWIRPAAQRVVRCAEKPEFVWWPLPIPPAFCT